VRFTGFNVSVERSRMAVEHWIGHPEIEGSGSVTATGTGREKCHARFRGMRK
jgi:hypothetical protein